LLSLGARASIICPPGLIIFVQFGKRHLAISVSPPCTALLTLRAPIRHEYLERSQTRASGRGHGGLSSLPVPAVLEGSIPRDVNSDERVEARRPQWDLRARRF